MTETHGLYRIERELKQTGDLPEPQRSESRAVAEELLDLVAGNDVSLRARYAHAARLTAIALTVVNLGGEQLRQLREAGQTWAPFLKVYGSYLEIARRDLEMLGLTPNRYSRDKGLGDVPGGDDTVIRIRGNHDNGNGE